MSTVTFDTLKFVEKLKDAGMPESQAKALSEAFQTASGELDLASKKDIQLELAPLKADMTTVKWMGGIIVSGIMLLILKTFFPA